MSDLGLGSGDPDVLQLAQAHWPHHKLPFICQPIRQIFVIASLCGSQDTLELEGVNESQPCPGSFPAPGDFPEPGHAWVSRTCCAQDLPRHPSSLFLETGNHLQPSANELKHPETRGLLQTLRRGGPDAWQRLPYSLPPEWGSVQLPPQPFPMALRSLCECWQNHCNAFSKVSSHPKKHTCV